MQNSSELSRQNREWVERAHRILDSHLQDVFAKAEFHGHVTIDVIIQNNRVIGVDPTTRQTIRK